MQTSHSHSHSPSPSQDSQHLVKCQLGINIVATTTEERGCAEHCRRGIRYSHSYLTRNNHKISKSFLPPPSLLGDNTQRSNASSANFLGCCGSKLGQNEAARVLLANYLMGFLQRTLIYRRSSTISSLGQSHGCTMNFIMQPREATPAAAKDAISRARLQESLPQPTLRSTK